MTVPDVPQTKLLKYDELSTEQIELIKRTFAKGASDDELKLFIAVCNSTGLSPFNRQIYAIKRRSQEKGQWVETMTYQVGIEGFRLMAQRSRAKGGPVYQGQTEPQWCAKDGNWVGLWTSDDPPFAARVGVYVEDFREPIYAIAEWKRLVQTKQDGNPNIFWDKGGPFQLAKCAEAAALRKAIGHDLSGVYLEEEIYAIPEEKDITPPMTVEDHKKALLPPAGPKATLATTEGAKDATKQPVQEPGKIQGQREETQSSKKGPNEGTSGSPKEGSVQGLREDVPPVHHGLRPSEREEKREETKDDGATTGSGAISRGRESGSGEVRDSVRELPQRTDPSTRVLPKGERIISPERRQKVIEHLQTIGLVDMPPPEMTEIEANMVLGCKSKKVAGNLLDKMAISKDTQGKMV